MATAKEIDKLGKLLPIKIKNTATKCETADCTAFISTMQEQADTIKSRFSTLQKTIEDLTNQLSTLREELLTVKGNNSELHTAHITCLQEKEALSTQTSDYNSALSECKKDLSTCAFTLNSAVTLWTDIYETAAPTLSIGDN